MQVGGPVTPVHVRLIRKADAADVVGQGIDPDVHHMIGVAGYLDAPVEGGARDRQILEPAFDKTYYFGPAGIGTDEVRLCLVKGKQPILIGGESEEIAFFLDPFDLRALRTTSYVVIAHNRLVFGIVSL